MNNQQNVFFFETKKIPDSSILFEELKKQTIFFTYFQVDQKYYLFVYSKKFIEIDLLYQSVELIQELDSKKRQIRSLRGFFLYALEIMENGKDCQILYTNLKPFFWRKVKKIIHQNKKGALKEFLFGSQKGSEISSNLTKDFEAKIQILQNQVASLQQEVIDLKMLLEAEKTPVKRSLNPQLDDTTLNRINGSKLTYYEFDNSFISLAKISEKDQIEIIKLGFQLNQKGKISLKKYYEGTGEYTLFEWKGYKIKYASIRNTKIYKNFKAKE